ncbi:MAG: tetratricopeptide repeat protein [Burkholderiales bacterium]|nr:tetratricopeptide repeat protein [Burkholderiales bacterium]
MKLQDIRQVLFGKTPSPEGRKRSVPDEVESHLARAKSCLQEGKFEESLVHSAMALQYRPENLIAWKLRGAALYELGRCSEAENCFSKVVSLRPDHAEGFYDLGRLLQMQKKYIEAANRLELAIELKPEFPEAHRLLGETLTNLGRYEEAEQSLLKVLNSESTLKDALSSLGKLYALRGRHPDAISCYRKLVSFDPSVAAKSGLAFELQQLCQWNELEMLASAIRRGISDEGDPVHPMHFVALPGTTAMEQRLVAEKWTKSRNTHLASIRENLGFAFEPRKGGKVRIGYLSVDFRDHPAARLLQDVIGLHDRKRYHVCGYSCTFHDLGAHRVGMEQDFDEFSKIGNLSAEEAARKIFADGIDILIDLAGHTSDTIGDIMALRPAKVQVSHLGFHGTSGADYIDFLIADEHLVPPWQLEYYSERLAFLPDSFMPAGGSSHLPSPSRRDWGLPENAFVFASFGRTYKITPQLFDVWCDLLRSVPDSVLWIAAEHREAQGNLLLEAQNRGIGKERIVFAKWLSSHHDHQTRLQCADLFLDTSPCNSSAACIESLWVGVPVVTVSGRTFASKTSGSELRALGIPELITHSLAEYRSLALELALQPERLASFRKKIAANRNTMPLFDTVRYTRNLEKACEWMLDEAL